MPPRAATSSSSSSPTGAAGGDLSGTYPNPTVAQLDGVAPTAFALDFITAGNAADGRDKLELGTVATQEASAVALTGGTATGVAGNARTTSAGTATLVLSDVGGIVVFGASSTVTITAGLPTGSPIRIAASAAATLTWALSGGESVSEATTALTAGQGRLLIKESALVWRVVQSGASVGATRLRGYIDGGVAYMVAQGYDGSAWVDIGSPVEATSGGAGGLTSLSGSTWTLDAGATAVTKPDPTTVGAQGRTLYWALSSFALPSFGNGSRVSLVSRVGTRPTAAYAAFCVTCLSGAWTTSGQTQVGVGLTYQTNKSIAYLWGANNFGVATNNASFDEAPVAWLTGIGTGVIGYRTTNKATYGSITTGVSAGASAISHVGVTLCAIGGTTVAQADFVSPEWYLSVVDA